MSATFFTWIFSWFMILTMTIQVLLCLERFVTIFVYTNISPNSCWKHTSLNMRSQPNGLREGFATFAFELSFSVSTVVMTFHRIFQFPFSAAKIQSAQLTCPGDLWPCYFRSSKYMVPFLMLLTSFFTDKAKSTSVEFAENF